MDPFKISVPNGIAVGTFDNTSMAIAPAIDAHTDNIHYIAKSIGSPPSNEQVWLL